MMLRRHPNVFECDLSGSVILFESGEGKYFRLNVTGRAIWAMLCGPRSVDEITEDLGRTYNVDRESCHSTVHAWASEMVAHHLLIQE